jgi:hypothetical protein
MTKTFKIEGYENIFEVADQSATQTTYGAIAGRTGEDGQHVAFHAFFVTPFPDMVESA